MTKHPTDLRGDRSATPARARLDSWKEIASYLRRSIRTVRRWEENEGLPVRRHKHEKGSSVFAYQSELDAWWENRFAVHASPEQTKRRYLFPRKARTFAVSAAALLVVGGMFFGGQNGVWRPETRAPERNPLHERDSVLIANFDNRTGYPVLDDTLEHVLEREIRKTHFLKVVSRKRIEDVLRLMRKPLDSTVDARLGREICLRDGRGRALLAGRVERLGSDYVLSVDLLDPFRGVVMASVNEAVTDLEQILPAVRRLSRRVGKTLIEELPQIEEIDRRLEKVTTTSLRALRLYTQADALIDGGHPSAAEELLREAVSADPEFASGYIQLAWAIRKQGRSLDEYRPPAERAFKLARISSDRERYFIRGSYYHMTGEYKRAMASYEALLSLDAGHYWGSKNSLDLCRQMDRRAECVRYQLRVTALRPEHFQSNYEAAWALAVWTANPGQAEKYLNKARKLLSVQTVQPDPEGTVRTELFSTYRHWLVGDLSRIIEDESRFTAQLDSWSPAVRDGLARELGYLCLALGRLRAAEAWFRRISDPIVRHETLARVVFVREDNEALRQHLIRGSTYREPFTAIMLSMSGLSSQAEELVADLEKEGVLAGYFHVVRGSLALVRGRRTEAISNLKAGVAQLQSVGDGVFLAGSDLLAVALKRQGDLRQAIQVLELASQQKGRAAFLGAGVFWMRCEFRRAQFYWEIGRDEDARKIAADLTELLAYADQDHPMLIALKRLSVPTG